MKTPYGNQLVNQIVSHKKLKKLTSLNRRNIFNLTEDDYINLVNICIGLYSPLTGFCDEKTYNSIIKKNKISNNLDWSIPILFNYPLKKNFLIKNEFFKLKYNKRIVGAINVENTFKINKKLFNLKVFGTNSTKHPGVIALKKKNNFFIGGKVYLLKNAIPRKKYFFTPFKLRQILKKKKIYSNTAFSTRNICHLGHFFIHRHILKKTLKLFITIIQCPVNKYNPKIIWETYEIAKRKIYLKKKIEIITIYMPSFFAGPKEAFLQAIMMQNLGFNNFIIGRDHAGVKNFYGKYESQKFFEKVKNLSINIIKTKEPKLCMNCKTIRFENSQKNCEVCLLKDNFTSIDGQFVRNKIIKRDFHSLKGFLHPQLISYFKTKKNIFKRVA